MRKNYSFLYDMVHIQREIIIGNGETNRITIDKQMGPNYWHEKIHQKPIFALKRDIFCLFLHFTSKIIFDGDAPWMIFFRLYCLKYLQVQPSGYDLHSRIRCKVIRKCNFVTKVFLQNGHIWCSASLNMGAEFFLLIHFHKIVDNKGIRRTLVY